MNRLVIVFFLTILAGLAHAQLNMPPASPDATFKQQIGFGEVEVKYSRPSARGRVIFGGLIPFGEIWRTGAHDATTIHFSEVVKLNGYDIPADTFSLFTIPNQNEWTIIINKTAKMHGTSDYTPEQDLVRFTVKPEKSVKYYETFTIEINDLSKDEAVLYLLWENTQVKLTIKMSVDEKVMSEINERINVKKEDRASLYYQSSAYYFNNNKDLKQAYAWAQVANSKTQDAGYLQLQAKIEAALNDYAAALKTLKASTDLAVTKKLDQVIAANEKLRTEWTSKSGKK